VDELWTAPRQVAASCHAKFFFAGVARVATTASSAPASLPEPGDIVSRQECVGVAVMTVFHWFRFLAYNTSARERRDEPMRDARATGLADATNQKQAGERCLHRETGAG